MSDVTTPLPFVALFRNNLTLASALIGCGIGAALCGLQSYNEGLNDAFLAGLYVFVLIFGTGLLLTWPQQAGRRSTGYAVLGSLLLALLLALTTAWVASSQSFDAASALWTACIVPIAYVVVAFLQCRTAAQENEKPFSYERLGRFAWSNAFFLLTGGVLCGVFWLLILLWAYLFLLLEISFFADLFKSPYFICLASSVITPIGIALGREKANVIATLTGLIMTLGRFLLPLVSLLALAFLLTLAVRGTEFLWQTGAATPLLLGLAATLIFFTNTAAQALPGIPLLPRPVRYLVNAALVSLPIYAGLALWAIWLRIDQYGLVPQRLWACAFIFIAFLYAFAYAALPFLKRGAWLEGVRFINPPLALFSVGLVWFLNLPFVPLAQISAENQAARLLSGTVSASMFDYHALRSKLGPAGNDVLRSLPERASAINHPETERIIREVESQRTRPANPAERELEKQKREAEKKAAIEADPLQNVVVISSGITVDLALVRELRLNRLHPSSNRCEGPPCFLIASYLDNQFEDRPVYIWFSSLPSPTHTHNGQAFSLSEDGELVKIGKVSTRGKRSTGGRSVREDIDILKENGLRIFTPRFKEVLLGEDLHLRIEPANE